jgi:hypothetical protein
VEETESYDRAEMGLLAELMRKENCKRWRREEGEGEERGGGGGGFVLFSADSKCQISSEAAAASFPVLPSAIHC